MSLDNVYRLSVIGQWNAAAEIVNVFHYRPTVANIAASAQQLAEYFNEEAMSGYLSLISAANAVQKIVVVPAVGDGEGYELAVNLNGTASGDSVAAQVSPLISWKTARRGKSFRGRTYLPPCSETVINGNFTAAYIDAVTDWAFEIMTLEDALSIPFWQLVVASYTKVEANDITSAFVPLYPATQRRRRPGRGS